MATVYYPAIVERGRRGFGVFFPDLPGCTSAGATVNEAALNAEEALAGHLIVAEQYGDVVPEPSELDGIEVDPDIDEVARLLVRGERKGKAVRINITLDEGLVAAIDRVAENRSGFLAEAARVSLAARREGADGRAGLMTDWQVSPTVFVRNGDVRIDVPLGPETGRFALKRTVVVSGEAIEDFLRLSPDAAASLSDAEKEEFALENLEMILRRAVEITAAKVIVSDMRIDAPRGTGLPDLILVRAGQL